MRSTRARGSQIWQYQRDPVSTTPQRGTAVHGNKVFVTTNDSKLVALDARTGSTIWETLVAGERYRFAGQAPLVAKGKIIMTGNQPFGFIQAYDVETGKHLWTWNAIPQSDEGSRRRNVGERILEAWRRAHLGERKLRS